MPWFLALESLGYSLAAVGRLLIVVAPQPQSTGAGVHMDSAAAVLGHQGRVNSCGRETCCSKAREVFPGLGLNMFHVVGTFLSTGPSEKPRKSV